MPLDEMMSKISHSEYVLLLAEYGLTPWGNDWDQTATLACAIVNTNPYVKKNITADDVIPGRKQSRMSAEYQHRKELIDRLKSEGLYLWRQSAE